MRLLVLDGSLVLRHLVERLVPGDVSVESAATFEQGYDVICANPPDAVIVNLGPSDLPWRKIQRCCRGHKPPIPILFESCVYATSKEAGLDDINGSGAFLRKPYHTAQLAEELDRLMMFARRAHASVAVD